MIRKVFHSVRRSLSGRKNTGGIAPWLSMLKAFAFALLLCLVPTLVSYAEGDVRGIYDESDLLSDEEEAKLLKKLNRYAGRYDCDIAIVTTNDADSMTAQEYADQYAENLGMAMTSDGYAGILFLIDMDNREIYICTSGKAISYYSDERIQDVLYDSYYRIVEGDYYGCCDKFLRGVRTYMGRSTSQSGRMSLTGMLARLAISLGLGGYFTSSMVKKRGGRITTSASTYLDVSSSKVTAKQDKLVNRTVTRRRIYRNRNHHPSGGFFGGGMGGGGFHMSGGGGHHGGGGMKF